MVQPLSKVFALTLPLGAVGDQLWKRVGREVSRSAFISIIQPATDFAFRIGLPGKSGVGGGNLAVAPGVVSIAVWSPGLDASGNAHLAALAQE